MTSARLRCSWSPTSRAISPARRSTWMAGCWRRTCFPTDCRGTIKLVHHDTIGWPARLVRLAQRPIHLCQVRAHRDVERFAGGEPIDEPSRVQAVQGSLTAHALEAGSDQIGEGGIVP